MAKLNRRIKNWMQLNAEDYSGNFGRPCDLNITQMAEDCANDLATEFGQAADDWLDDETHIVWDIAVDVGDWWEAQF